MLLRIVIGVLLLLHGLIHLVLALVPNPDADQPAVATFFSGWARPWLRDTLSGGTLQAIPVVLAVLAGLAFIAAGLAMFDFLVPHDWWRIMAIAGSIVSLILCLLFWNTNLIVGPLVAVAILVVVGILHWPGEALLGY